MLTPSGQFVHNWTNISITLLAGCGNLTAEG